MASPFVVTLAAADRQILEATARSGRAEHRQVVRARIVLAAADGQSNAGIARELRIVVDTVRKWRTRFCQQGLSGLRDRPRGRRPRVFGAAGRPALAGLVQWARAARGDALNGWESAAP
jgi:hypothetical protein